MSMVSTAVRSGFARGGIELRQTITTVTDLWTYLFPSVMVLGTIFFMRGAHVPGTDFSLGARTLPSSFGMGLAFAGLITVAQLLMVDREDGTLLRAKATPNGMAGYLVGKVVLVGGMTVITFLIQLIPGLFLVDGTTAGILFGWAVAGLLTAPVVLRRMARRESGSAVAARRERAMKHVGG
jgi:ABC-2 type transport system permease protein